MERSCDFGATLPVGDLSEMFQLQPTDDEITDDSESVVSSEQVVSSDSSSDGDGTDDEEALFIREDSDDATL